MQGTPRILEQLACLIQCANAVRGRSHKALLSLFLRSKAVNVCMMVICWSTTLIIVRLVPYDMIGDDKLLIKAYTLRDRAFGHPDLTDDRTHKYAQPHPGARQKMVVPYVHSVG